MAFICPITLVHWLFKDYCEIGLQASHDYFIAKYLGYGAAMFDGSIHQWSHMNNLPLVAGTALR